jgi:hypothetical protein
MIVYIVFFIGMCSILLWVTIRQKDAFPFSWYPMYSGTHALDKISIVRIALQQQDGGVAWWQSRFYRYPEYTGRKLRALQQAINSGTKNDVFVLLERNRLLLEVLRLIESEQGSAKDYTAFHIVERTVNNNLAITDRTIGIISFSELRNGKPA